MQVNWLPTSTEGPFYVDVYGLGSNPMRALVGTRRAVEIHLVNLSIQVTVPFGYTVLSENYTIVAQDDAVAPTPITL